MVSWEPWPDASTDWTDWHEVPASVPSASDLLVNRGEVRGEGAGLEPGQALRSHGFPSIARAVYAVAKSRFAVRAREAKRAG